jgi:hypothetical protein
MIFLWASEPARFDATLISNKKAAPTFGAAFLDALIMRLA